MAVNQSRRDALLGAIAGFAGIGGAAAAYSMYKTWEPLPSVKAAGTTRVDISPITDGEMRTVTFRGKPVFILKHTPDMKTDEERDVKIGSGIYTVVIGICTHLGCIPNWEADKKVWHCPCHGGEFDCNGINVFGPPPIPLVIPAFKIDGNTLVLGEEGPEYEKIPAKFKA